MADERCISVILPHLNQPAYLERTLIALRAQDYPDRLFEIIVVDNGSKPETLDAVGKLSATYNFKLLHERELGPGPARNKGVSESMHDLLAFIDSDCVPDSHWLSAIAGFATQNPDVAFGGDVRILYVDPENLTEIEAYESVFAYQQKNYIEQKNFSGTGNLSMHRNIYEKVGPFRGLGVAEDRDWGQRATKQGVSILYCPNMIVFHPGRVSFEELCVKWRRHILHDLEQNRERNKTTLDWLINIIVVLCSIPVHTIKTLLSNRLSRPGDRLMAIRCLIRIRLYRVFYMLKVFFTPKETESGPQWNR